jgi:hypothetical protein
MRSFPAILVIYENRDYFERIRRALEPVGYVLNDAHSADALATFERLQPPFVILCPCTPKPVRDELTREFKLQNPKVTILLVDPEDEEQLRKLVQ